MRVEARSVSSARIVILHVWAYNRAMAATSFHDYIMAMNRVEQRLRTVTAALDAAGIDYAVVGGNAVAAWVARVDPVATRTTKDVDLLLRRTDSARVTEALGRLRFQREEVLGVTMFIDPDEPSVRGGVHIIWADEPVRPENAFAAPSVHESEVDPQGFRVIALDALLRMKLTSFRRIDQVHIEDLLRVHLVTTELRRALPHALAQRLAEVEASIDQRP